MSLNFRCAKCDQQSDLMCLAAGDFHLCPLCGVAFRTSHPFATLVGAVAKAPDDADAHYRLGWALGQEGQFEAAAECLRVAVSLKKDLSRAFCCLAASYNRLERYSEAFQAITEAVRLDPGDWDAYLQLGLIHEHLQHTTEAMQAFKVAVDLKPDFAEAHYHLGWTYDAAGQPGPAVEEFKQAARLKPGYRDPCLALSHFFEFCEQGKKVPEDEEVMKVLRDWAKRRPRFLTDIFFKWSVEDKVYEERPLGALEESTRATPENAVAWYRLGRAYTARQQKAKGMWALRKAVSLDPCLAEAWCALSQDCPLGSAGKFLYLRWPYEA